MLSNGIYHVRVVDEQKQRGCKDSKEISIWYCVYYMQAENIIPPAFNFKSFQVAKMIKIVSTHCEI